MKNSRAYRNQSPTWYGIDGRFATDTHILAQHYYYDNLLHHGIEEIRKIIILQDLEKKNKIKKILPLQKKNLTSFIN